MEEDETIYATRERPFSAHHMFLGAARVALEDSKDKRPGLFYSNLVALTMSALAIEALCNAVGERIIDDWNDFESGTPVAKLRLLCDHLSIDFDKNIEPWSTAIWLSKLRNKLAHAKPQYVSESYEWSRAEFDNLESKTPESKLEKEITLGNARRAYEQVTTIKSVLCKQIPVKKAFGIYADSTIGRSSAIPET
jgi:hypothetical protein